MVQVAGCSSVDVGVGLGGARLAEQEVDVSRSLKGLDRTLVRIGVHVPKDKIGSAEISVGVAVKPPVWIAARVR